MTIKKVIEPGPVHKDGNNDKVEGGRKRIPPIPFLIRMRAVFICLLILLAAGIGVVSATAMEGVEPAKIISWSNTKTGDQKTVFQVEPGEQITFSVSAEGGEKYQWLVDGVVQGGAIGSSFTWTVANEDGMWKILVKTTNSAWENQVDKEQESLAGWIDRIESEYKDRFIHDMIGLSVYPIEAQKEWIVSTSLTMVNPDESIQEAINNLPAEGGIVELAPGTHEVDNTLYPPGTFVYKYKNTTYPYSILINRSNVTIYGTDESIVRHHNDSVDCFYIPDLDRDSTNPDIYHENIVFKGFTTTSTYTEYAGNAFIRAHHVKNFTVEDMHDSCYAAYFVWAGAAPNKAQEQWKRRCENVYYKNNIVEYTRLFGAYWMHVYQLNNTLRNCQRSYGCFGSTLGCGPLHVVGNQINGGLNGGINVFKGEGPRNVRNNIVQSSNWGIWIGSGIHDVLVKDNIITGTREAGIFSKPQGTTKNNLIVNNLIYNNSGHGFWASKYFGEKLGSESDIVNNVIYNNDGDGIRIDGWAWTTGLTVTNNIIMNNKGYGVNRIEGNITHSYNDVWGNARGRYNGTDEGEGEIEADPLFADPDNGDFHLKSTGGRWNGSEWVTDDVDSPCIDAGDPVEVLTEEYTDGLIVVVDEVTGITGGDTIHITDGVNTENSTANSTTATTINLTEAFTNNYSVTNNAYVYTISSDYSRELLPNDGRINMGAYGNTVEASKSPTPPASITNLQNTTGQTWICWTWINPTDDDFNHTMVFLDGNWKTNTSKSYYIAKGFDANTNHEISTHTVDKNGNVNETWVNQTAKTNLLPDTPPIIININITDITLCSASITWDTNDISDSLIRYGTSSKNYTKYVINEMFVRNHSIRLTGLEQDTTYYYVVNSTNPDSLSDQSDEYDFTTVSGCFIATAAYGTSLHKTIDILRSFRDKVLMQTPPGRTLVSTYYSTSPPIANALAKNDSLKSAVRVLLITPLVYFAEMILNGIGLIAIVFLGFGAFFVVMRSLKAVLKAFGLGLLTAVVLTGIVFALGWLAYTYPVCAVIAAYILPIIIPASMGVSIMVLVLLKSQDIIKNHEIAQD